MASDFAHKMTASIPFPSEREATIAYNTLAVDKEPTDSSKRTLILDKSTVTMVLEAQQMKVLRVAAGSFFDMLGLTIDTIQGFDPETNKFE
eukprot:m.132829 g.132829  ORF g.132829 m.132829 type:complete len:91 (-) comp14653_c0_seq3:2503-2775(-)